jgi:hypothetical protein
MGNELRLSISPPLALSPCLRKNEFHGIHPLTTYRCQFD